MNPHKFYLSCALCLGLSVATGAGAILYTDNRSGGMIDDIDPQFIDIDGNGTNDLHFFVGTLVSIRTLDLNRVLGISVANSVHIENLLTGTPIGQVPDFPFVWTLTDQPLSGCVFFEGIQGPVCRGPFAGAGGVFGFEFQIDGQAHYGWGRYEPNEPFNTGYILEWAYEDEPGVGILAGAVPEPSSGVLLLAATLLLSARRRR